MGSIPVRVIKKSLILRSGIFLCNPYEESKEHGRPQAAKKSPVGSFLVFGSHPVGMSNVVAAAALRKGVFNLTRTGIAAELTAASEQRLPPVGGRCRIATKRGVQGSEAGAVVSGMRTPLQGVKHTLGTTTRDRAAVRLHLEYHMPFYGQKTRQRNTFKCSSAGLFCIFRKFPT